jgi:hypothetical protein
MELAAQIESSKWPYGMTQLQGSLMAGVLQPHVRDVG